VILMALKSIFDSNRRREIRKALAQGESPFRKPQKAGLKSDSVIEVDERDIIDVIAPPPLPTPASLQPAQTPVPSAGSETIWHSYLKRRPIDEELIAAFEKHSTKRMKEALDKGANVDAQDRMGRTCLMRAAQAGDEGMMNFLLGHWAGKGMNPSMSAEDNEGRTALAYAAKAGKANAAQILVSKHTSVNTCDKHRQTPLMHAAMGGHLETVKLLVGHIADVSAKDENHATARWYAESKGHTKTAEYLRQCERMKSDV